VAFRIDRIKSSDLRSGFECGHATIDAYFSKYAVSNDRLNIGKTYVLRNDGTDPPSVVGFFTLSMAVVGNDSLPEEAKRGLPRYPMPVALIGQLGNDKRFRGQRLGERLLVEAFKIIAQTAIAVGCFGVVVDAIDDDAIGFYKKYGFELLPSQDKFPKRMFMPLATAVQAIQEAG
jgi:GNAT superfamily N-acetyltransferase